MRYNKVVTGAFKRDFHSMDATELKYMAQRPRIKFEVESVRANVNTNSASLLSRIPNKDLINIRTVFKN